MAVHFDPWPTIRLTQRADNITDAFERDRSCADQFLESAAQFLATRGLGLAARMVTSGLGLVFIAQIQLALDNF